MILNIKVPYAIDDLIADIVSKNKYNIEDLYEKLSQTPSQNDLDEINKLIGSYQADDPNGQLDSNQSVIANLVIVKENLTSALNRIKSNEERLTIVEPIVTDNTSRIGVVEPIVKSNTDRILVMEPIIATHTNEINKLQTDGVGSYLGTYKGSSADNFEVLPTPANDQERAIIEFDDNGEIMYQEYKWLNNQWNKIGVPLDSHIHSQGPGITLQDVANQQDPKNKPFHSVEDLTKYKTQDEIYNAAYNSNAKEFTVPYGNGFYFGFIVIKDANQIIFECLTGAIGVFRFRQLTVKKGSDDVLPIIGFSKASGGTPTAVDDYTTKKYVDDIDKTISENQQWTTVAGDLLNYDGDIRIVVKEALQISGAIIYKGNYKLTGKFITPDNNFVYNGGIAAILPDKSIIFTIGYSKAGLAINDEQTVVDPSKYTVQGRLG